MKESRPIKPLNTGCCHGRFNVERLTTTHYISKATRSNVPIKCFPGARLRDMKHYSIPPLSTTKPKNVILHVGTNDLHNKKPADIMKDARELCDQIQNTCPNSTISSIITRNDDENGFKVFEVNNLLRQLCGKKYL